MQKSNQNTYQSAIRDNLALGCLTTPGLFFEPGQPEVPFRVAEEFLLTIGGAKSKYIIFVMGRVPDPCPEGHHTGRVQRVIYL
jgi:hypothetical protein